MTTIRWATAAIAVLMMAVFPMKTNAQARFSFGLEFGTPPVNRFYVSLGEYYDVPYRDIFVMHEAGVIDEDMPVILYIYTHSQYSLRQIYSLRLRGATWENLSNWCGVPLYRDRGGPPFGNAYGYYDHGPGKRWNGQGRWRDEDGGQRGRWGGPGHDRSRYHERDDD